MKTLHFKADQVFISCYQPTNKRVLCFSPNFLCSVKLGLSLYVCTGSSSRPHSFLQSWSLTSSSLGLFFVLPLTRTGSFHALFVRAPSRLWLLCPLHSRRTRARKRALAQLWLSVVPPCAWALLSPSGVRKSLLLVSAGKLVYPPPNPAFITLPK